MNEGYRKFIEDNLTIVNKKGEEVDFLLNLIQSRYLLVDSIWYDYILKARQQGFSSLILAVFTGDFILKENSRSVVVADISDNAQELLDRVKFFLRSYERKNNIKIPLKYNSKYELFYEGMNTRYTIGTSTNIDFGRSKTITNLHLSEFNFYNNPQALLAGALQAVVPDKGKVIIETTANGFNEGKTLWDECELGEKPFKPLFYPASKFYDQEFLKRKRQELGRLFPQEYPETATEAFITSGDTYFDKQALGLYLEEVENVKPLPKT